MRVLVACEYSGTVRDAFIARGHDAISCDLLPTDSPDPRYQGDVFDIIEGWKPVKFTAECDPDGEGFCQETGCDVGDCLCIDPTRWKDRSKTFQGIANAMADQWGDL